MADNYRVTFAFQHSYFGFSETWFLPNASPSALLDKTGKLLYTRCGMLEQQYNPLAVRIAKDDNTRSSRLLVVGENDTSDMGQKTFIVPANGSYTDETHEPSGDVGPDNSDQTRACMQLEGINAGKRVCLRYLVGVPDFVSLTEPKTIKDRTSGQWWPAFDRWVKEIKTAGWCIRSLNKNQVASGDTLANPLIDVIGWELRGPAPSIIGLQMNLALPFDGKQGDRILLQKVKMANDGLRSPNGRWTIDAVGTNTGTQVRTIWLRNSQAFDPSTFQTLGKFRRELFVYTPLANLAPVRMGTHKRGKPFFSPRGRARTRRYAN